MQNILKDLDIVTFDIARIINQPKHMLNLKVNLPEANKKSSLYLNLDGIGRNDTEMDKKNSRVALSKSKSYQVID